MWTYRTPGILGGLFFRKDDILITKEKARVVAISKARLKRGDIVTDIGCGTGSLIVKAEVWARLLPRPLGNISLTGSPK